MLSSPPWCAALSTSLSLLPLAWPTEGLRQSEMTPPLQAVVLRSFQNLSKAIYFHNLSWIRDSRGHRDHRTCVSTWRCFTCVTSQVFKYKKNSSCIHGILHIMVFSKILNLSFKEYWFNFHFTPNLETKGFQKESI
jgi:hypothetical protein